MPTAPADAAVAAWPADPLDRFVLDRLTKEGLRPAPPADRETWLRRGSLDLTGLPPSPEERAAFLADDSPSARERMVDRLLASPRHAEKMAMQWLDVARYADTNGYNNDEATEQTATPPRNQERPTPPSATILDRPAPPFSTVVNTLDDALESLARGICDPVTEVAQKVGQMTLEHFRHFDDGAQPAPHAPRVPPAR